MKIKGFKISRRRAIIYLTYAVMIMLTLVLKDTFSDFTNRNEGDAANIKVANMNYNLVINGTQTTTIHVPANKETIANIIINSLNTVDSKYEVIYGVCPTEACTSLIETPANFYVEYSSRTTDPITDVIKADESKIVRLGITNNTSTGYYLKLGINAGYIHNTLALKNQIINEYNEEDVTIAAIIAGEISTTFPTTNAYVATVKCQKNNKTSPAIATVAWEESQSKWILNVTGVDSGKTVCNVYFDHSQLNNYIMALAANPASTGVYIENGYRYQGLNPNNYVSFNNELWRIIGVFDDNTHEITYEHLVKIIRADSIGDKYWDYANTYNNSSIKDYLNWDYYNSITSTSKSLIENATWKLGWYDPSYPHPHTPLSAYTLERAIPFHWTGFIGLMYPSDYGYAVIGESCFRDRPLDNYDNTGCYDQNWLYLGGVEWTITTVSESGSPVVCVHNGGGVGSNHGSMYQAVRPSLYLKSNTKRISGDGSINDPFVLSE